MSSRTDDDAVAPRAAEPRWLDAEEQKAWRAWLYGTLLLQDTLDRELTRGTGISHAYYEILVQLSEAPGRMLRMSQLADRSLSSRSRLSHAVSRLEERGWVRRQLSEDDGRGQLAVLTDEGFAALEAAAPVHVEGVRTHLFDQLTPEQVTALRDIGETLLSHLGPY
jgi:DNA-binding MarR family transcriptional regulator